MQDGQGNLEGFVLEAGLLDKIRDYFNVMFCLASGPGEAPDGRLRARPHPFADSRLARLPPGPLVGVITDANKKTVLEVR